MKKGLWFFVAIWAVCLTACTGGNKGGRLNELSWLEGVWSINGDSTMLSETWERKNDSTFRGNSFQRKNNDTVFNEMLTLEQHGDEVFYTATVSSQNQGRRIIFRLASAANGEFVFENAGHDFPQRIVYTHPTPDSIYAYI